MIEKALVFIRNRLNSYLKLKTGEDNKISLTNLTDNSGKTILKEVGIVLVNLEEETSIRNQEPYRQGPQGSFEKVSPGLHLNLYLLIAANFGESENDYRESLKFLSHIATYFQGNGLFTPTSHPDLDTGISRLSVEHYSLSLESQNNLWASLGAKYLPSLVYKIRMICLKEEEISMVAPPVTEVNLFD
jgi:hypothetical protein